MMLIFCYTLFCYGLASAFVYYDGPFDIITKFRESITSNKYFESLFSCMFCLPVNIGMVLSIISLLFGEESPFTPFTVLMQENTSLWPLIILFDGFYTGATVSIIDGIFDKISETKQILD